VEAMPGHADPYQRSPLGPFPAERTSQRRASGSSRRTCTASKLVAWCLPGVSWFWLGGLVVVADHASEGCAPPDGEVQRGRRPGVLVGRALLAGLVGPVPVVMAGVVPEHISQVPFVVDEHPVGARGSCCAYPPFGVAVRPRRPRRGHYSQALAGEISSKAQVNLASRSRITKRNAPVRSPRSMTRLRACWAVQSPSGCCGHFHDEQHVQAAEEDRVDVEEVAGQQPVSLALGGMSARRWPALGVPGRGRCGGSAGRLRR
jgi:hypothetical protein